MDIKELRHKYGAKSHLADLERQADSLRKEAGKLSMELEVSDSAALHGQGEEARAARERSGRIRDELETLQQKQDSLSDRIRQLRRG